MPPSLGFGLLLRPDLPGSGPPRFGRDPVARSSGVCARRFAHRRRQLTSGRTRSSRDVRARVGRRRDGRAARAPRAPPRGSGTRTSASITTWSRLISRTNTQAPIVGFTPIRLPGLAGRHDHGDRRHDVQRREHEVAGSGQPAARIDRPRHSGMRPSLVDGDHRCEHEEVEPDHEGAHLHQDPEAGSQERRRRSSTSSGSRPRRCRRRTSRGARATARRRHARRDVAVFERLDDGAR